MGVVDKFLYFFELKYGVLIVGFVDIILSILCGCYLPWIRRKVDEDFWILTQAAYTIHGQSLAKRSQLYDFYVADDFYFNRFGYSMYIFCLIVLVLHIGASILIIVSVLSEEKTMAAPYVATALMRFVVLLLILIWIVTKSFDCTTTFWLIGLSLFPATYFWLTVVSWYSPSTSE
ncbi:uncharacterized protein LOC120447153 [Drosophila santomea]|uniref:uncharacterized protein LOC120447153 n=1 Tax=Drosophila santomea TaxID=129105 RepID=UPI001953787A|nr:uncharacterized protein LOC120447153 [Drosophila santomea]XP_039484538.1 uncharacterized protein LOC120447153 [Drosophila santomea]XP_039484539.1 uncharacterized protein LOC120447153 [Drosophila santomea]XP_043861838.1 uncharacterized protein LOC120447153 [Drosophila santomea]